MRNIFWECERDRCNSHNVHKISLTFEICRYISIFYFYCLKSKSLFRTDISKELAISLLLETNRFVPLTHILYQTWLFIVCNVLFFILLFTDIHYSFLLCLLRELYVKVFKSLFEVIECNNFYKLTLFFLLYIERSKYESKIYNTRYTSYSNIIIDSPFYLISLLY